MKLPIIQSLWIGDNLTNLEKLCVQSFIDNGHEFHLYTYTDIGGIPTAAIVKDGNEILPADKIFRNKKGGFSGFANWFRYQMLYKNGGYWVDMDMVCLRPFDFENEIVFCEESHFNWFANFILRFPAKHPLMKAMVDICKTNSQIKNAAATQIGGPAFLTKQIKQAGLEELAIPYTRFFTLETQGINFLNDIYRDGLHFPQNMHSLHIGNSSIIAGTGIGKNAIFDSNSLFEKLKTKHGIKNLPNAKQITSEQINKIPANNIAKRKKRIKRERIFYLLIALMAGIAIGFVL